MKNYDNLCVKILFNDEIKVIERLLIGFLFCVYLYVFDNIIVKNISVFEYLKDYVICYIDSEIVNDNINSVKILFFVFLFYYI